MKVARTYHLRAMTRTYRFGSFELDLAAYVLKARGEIVRLEKIPMEVLILLVQRAGMLVERSHIAAAVWGSGVFVEQEAAINTAVRKIRQVLGDDAAVPRFVQTVVGKGYRFIATVENFSAAGESVGNPSAVQSGCPRYVVKVGRQEFVLPSGETVIGRDPAAGVYVDHPSVSRRHARLSIEAGRVRLQDLGSRNGTFLDGRQLDGAVDILEDAIIGLGPVTLVFNVVRAAASTQSMSAGDVQRQ
jgi:DNA-binding winged helix-turn-helix (wHTH) protein